MFNVSVMPANNVFDHIHTLFHLRGRQIFAEPQIHREQDCVQAKMHRQRFLHGFYPRIGFGQTPDTIQRFRIRGLADKKPFALTCE